MDEASQKNKKAWEYRAYEFWNMNYGSPKEKAAEILQNPKARLRYHQKYFEEVKDLNIANVCGSNGREVGDLNNVDLERFGKSFDIAYLEGGILHYFHDIDLFFHNLYCIIKPGGKLILSDLHPFQKIDATGYIGKFTQVTDGDYFDSRAFNGDVAYKSYFPLDEQQLFPDCSFRYYTLSEIINAAINIGFNIREFNEHPNWENRKIPGEFTMIGLK